MNKYVVPVLMLVLCGFASYVDGGTFKKTLNFDKGNLIFSQEAGYDVIMMKDGQVTDKVGTPQLPVKEINISIPSGAKVISVTVNSTESEIITGKYKIYPSQYPQVVSEAKLPFVAPDVKIYAVASEYPGELVEYNEGNMSGYKIVALRVHPVTYTPTEEQVKFYSKIELTINYKETKASSIKKTERGKELFRNMVKKMVINPEDVEINDPPYLPLADDSAEYLIVTDASLVSEFQRLANLQIAKGLTVQIKSTSWIYANYTTGRDRQENIWYFLKDYVANHGTIYVAMCGDTNMVPCRWCWWRIPMITDDKNITCDLYFSDLDGPWNSNDDANWGDPWYDDTPDMYPDVIVGRLPVGSLAEAQTELGKIETYTTNPPRSYLYNVLITSTISTSSIFDPRGNLIASDLPVKFNVTKCYQSGGCYGREDLVAQLNSGFHFIFWQSHGDSINMQTNQANSEPLRGSDADALINGDSLSIFSPISCKVARFRQEDCTAEHLMNCPTGGAVAFVGNACVGLNPQSDTIVREFANVALKDAPKPIGEAFVTVKTLHTSSAHSSDNDRLLQYGYNLIGDPAMIMYTDTTIIPIEEKIDFVSPVTKIYPNPSTGGVKFNLSGMNKGETISFQIYDLGGRLIRSFAQIVTNSTAFTVYWDGLDNNGKKMQTGTYFYKVKNNSGEGKGKFILLK